MLNDPITPSHQSPQTTGDSTTFLVHCMHKGSNQKEPERKLMILLLKKKGGGGQILNIA